MLIDGRWNSSIQDVRRFMGADCDTQITMWWKQKGRKRLTISKQEARKFYGEIFNLRKLNQLEVKK
jgi:hypothetical protein